jgi:hypothetical protein
VFDLQLLDAGATRPQPQRLLEALHGIGLASAVTSTRPSGRLRAQPWMFSRPAAACVK